jgi:hypothetical protein
MFELAKTFHTLNRAAAVIGKILFHLRYLYFINLSERKLKDVIFYQYERIKSRYEISITFNYDFYVEISSFFCYVAIIELRTGISVCLHCSAVRKSTMFCLWIPAVLDHTSLVLQIGDP